MRIAIAKPDYGIVGGFELVMQRVAAELSERGHTVDWLLVDVPGLGRAPFGAEVPDHVWQTQPEFFRYAALADAFGRVDAAGYDLLLTTQPPSFAMRHPHQLAVFYHHLRVYYDLSDVYVAAGMADDVELHHEAERRVRAMDGAYLEAGPQWILAGSEAVRERVQRYNGLSKVGVFHAGVAPPPGAASSSPGAGGGGPVCVSRHEFPKRTELFVHALKLLPDLEGDMVGGGGRLDWVRALDARLSQPGFPLDELGPHDLWMCRHDGPLPTASVPAESNVRFRGHVSDDELARLYAAASCVVAPAYLEDYGLTAIEAMHYGKPVIVCSDGGGLTAFVEDGVNGFVVDPTGPAIAAAVRKVTEDPALALSLGEAARETAQRFTWPRAMDEMQEGIDIAMGGGQ